MNIFNLCRTDCQKNAWEIEFIAKRHYNIYCRNFSSCVLKCAPCPTRRWLASEWHFYLHQSLRGFVCSFACFLWSHWVPRGVPRCCCSWKGTKITVGVTLHDIKVISTSYTMNIEKFCCRKFDFSQILRYFPLQNRWKSTFSKMFQNHFFNDLFWTKLR